MKLKIALFVFLACSITVSGQQEKRIVILHTNDLHSRLTGYAPESSYTPLTTNDDKTIGGFSRIAAIIKSEQADHPDGTLVVDAGDFMMGTLFPSLESETGFQLRLMKKMGYDAVGIGNHEFDYGPEWISGVISTSASKGEIPVILSANSVFSEKEGSDDAFEKLFTDKLVARSLVIEKSGLKIGLFSILGKEADSFAPKAVPVTFSDQVRTARKMVSELTDMKCDIIICISHSGIRKEKNGEWGGEDAELARKVKGLNLIIGGHSHTRLDQPLVVNGVPIVQTGEFGKNIGRLSLLCTAGKVSIDDYRLIPVDDRIAGDAEIERLIDEQKVRISGEVLKPMGLSYSGPIAETSFSVEGNDTGDFLESNLGPLVADAIHYYVNKGNSRGTDISMIAAGMLFDRILPGVQTAPDLFRVVPLGSGKDGVPGYPLARLYVTGKELKSILEVLENAWKSSAENYCYYSGFRVGYDPDKGFLRKIKKVEIMKPDGESVNVDFSKKNKTLYSVTADSYMLSFIGIIKKKSFGLINVVPKDAEGKKITDMTNAIIDMDEGREGVQEGKEWLAMISFLRSMKDNKGKGMPSLDQKYSSAVKCFYRMDGK